MARTTPEYVTVRGRLSKAEDERLTALHERGFSPGRIAEKMGRHPSAIYFATLRLGLREPTPRVQNRTAYLRNGRPVIPFGEDEDAFLQAARAAGHSMSTIRGAIEKRFGHARSANTLRCRLLQLAVREEAVPSEAERSAA